MLGLDHWSLRLCQAVEIPDLSLQIRSLGLSSNQRAFELLEGLFGIHEEIARYLNA